MPPRGLACPRFMGQASCPCTRGARAAGLVRESVAASLQLLLCQFSHLLPWPGLCSAATDPAPGEQNRSPTNEGALGLSLF